MTLAGLDPRVPERVAAGLWMQLVGFALVLGVLADALFNEAALGINVSLWLGTLVAAFVLIARRSGQPVGGLSAGLLLASFLISVLIAWRSAAALQIAVLATSIALLLLAVVVSPEARARRASVTLLVASVGLGVVSVVRGVLVLPRALEWRAFLDRGARREAQSVGRATLIAVPLVLVFGGLFFAADAVFQSWVETSVQFDLGSAVRHVAWWFGGATVSAGVLWCGVSTQPPVPAGPELAPERRFRSIETGVVLGALASLFAVFVVIQVQYLFGGRDHVEASIGLTYADYARRGFFELVSVAALLLPVLLAADWARARTGRSLTTFRVLTTLLLLLLVVVLTSAFERLRIYIDTFGLTALRFYAAALLVWLSAVFGWLLWSLFRERRSEFVAGAVLAGLVAVVIVVAVNPHGLIASTNLSRAEDGRTFDVAHALGLSADATPTLVDGIDALEGGDACELAVALQARWDEPRLELRSWNWGRMSAADAVESNRDRLAAACR